MELMRGISLQQPLVRYMIAVVWLINGLLCKVLGLVPRHERIVASILGSDHHAALFTTLIGFGEIGIAAWVLSGWKYTWCAVMQIALILSMNVIEFFLVPDLLLWGRANILFALLLVAIIYLNAFHQPRR